MSTVLLLRTEEGILFQRSRAALLNAIPPKVTLFTFGTISKLSLSLRDPRSGLLCKFFKVSWCKSIKAFVGKKKDFEFTSLFDRKPVKCNESCGVVFILAS